MTTYNQPAHRVRIVTGNPMAEHRAHEAHLLTGALTAVCAVAAGCAIVPALDNLLTGLVLATITALTGAGIARWVARRVRWWFEDRADTRTAASWRARHTHDAAQGTQDSTRVAVAS